MIFRKVILICVLIVFQVSAVSGQVRIRLFSLYTPESAVFSVTEGKYELETFNVITGKTDGTKVALLLRPH